MFDKKYEDRLRAWHNFRNGLETSGTPFQDVIDFYNRAPLVRIVVDPYDEGSWLDPWTLLYENKYCEFSIILGIAYSLQLTTRFSDSVFEIHICTDQENLEVKYLLFVDNTVIGYYKNETIEASKLPKNLRTEKIYRLSALQ
jgi:hypothetical protein